MPVNPYLVLALFLGVMCFLTVLAALKYVSVDEEKTLLEAVVAGLLALLTALRSYRFRKRSGKGSKPPDHGQTP